MLINLILEIEGKNVKKRTNLAVWKIPKPSQKKIIKQNKKNSSSTIYILT